MEIKGKEKLILTKIDGKDEKKIGIYIRKGISTNHVKISKTKSYENNKKKPCKAKFTFLTLYHLLF
jgi:hypothetical protein